MFQLREFFGFVCKLDHGPVCNLYGGPIDLCGGCDGIVTSVGMFFSIRKRTFSLFLVFVFHVMHGGPLLVRTIVAMLWLSILNFIISSVQTLLASSSSSTQTACSGVYAGDLFSCFLLYERN